MKFPVWYEGEECKTKSNETRNHKTDQIFEQRHAAIELTQMASAG